VKQFNEARDKVWETGNWNGPLQADGFIKGADWAREYFTEELGGMSNIVDRLAKLTADMSSVSKETASAKVSFKEEL